jgi:MFS family permease
MDATASGERVANSGRAPCTPSRRQDQWRFFITPVVVGLVIVLLNFANLLIVPPLNRLLEGSICREHFARHNPSLIPPSDNVPEHDCKIDAVQTELAKLIGLITTLGIICGEFVIPHGARRGLTWPIELVVTIPLGYLSDQFGRKMILYWNICAMALAYGWVMVVGLYFRERSREGVDLNS